MIRQLGQCPYCQRCEIALDDHPEVTFNPETGNAAPCEHLVWVDGRYAQWEPGPHGVNRMIGSTEFRWDHPGWTAVDPEGILTDFVRELVRSGKSWPFAPAGPFEIKSISADEQVVGPGGKKYTRWEVDGAAIFAPDPAHFLGELPGCQARQLEGLQVRPEEC